MTSYLKRWTAFIYVEGFCSEKIEFFQQMMVTNNLSTKHFEDYNKLDKKLKNIFNWRKFPIYLNMYSVEFAIYLILNLNFVFHIRNWLTHEFLIYKISNNLIRKILIQYFITFVLMIPRNANKANNADIGKAF